MEIRALDRAEYAGRRFVARYTTRGYYDAVVEDFSIAFRYTPFEAEVRKSFESGFFGDWLDHPVVLGAFEGDRLIGIAEGAPENWNRRYRSSNLCVFEAADRGRGVGRALMEAILAEARRGGARMAVLETQSCNEKAIAFYRRRGFRLIGCDLFSYSNDDPRRHEVRMEMGMMLDDRTRYGRPQASPVAGDG